MSIHKFPQIVSHLLFHIQFIIQMIVKSKKVIDQALLKPQSSGFATMNDTDTIHKID